MPTETSKEYDPTKPAEKDREFRFKDCAALAMRFFFIQGEVSRLRHKHDQTWAIPGMSTRSDLRGRIRDLEGECDGVVTPHLAACVEQTHKSTLFVVDRLKNTSVLNLKAKLADDIEDMRETRLELKKS